MRNRRDFFRVVAAGGATAAATGRRRTTETILPLVVPNEQIIPGVAAWFATVCRECPAGCGVIARNREGRVVKLEGNPDHPVNQGALCARGQAALQGLYHPDRFAGPRLRDGATLKPVPWDVAQKVVVDKLTELRSAAKGQAIAVVTQLEHSRLGALVDRWTQALGTRPRVTFEPFGYEALRAADSGVPVDTLVHFGEVYYHARPGLAVGGGGAVTGSNATAILVAINLLNAAAGNVGKTVRFGLDSAFGKVTPYAEMVRLVDAMARGEIEVLLLGSGVNPAYTLPGGLRFAH